MKHLAGNIPKIYAFHILVGLIFPVPIMVLFWQQHGMNLTMVMVLQSLFALSIVLLEVPSGYVADILGRRQSLIIAGGFYCLAISVYSVGENFWHFLIAEILFAGAVSFVSGADSAMLYDTLQALGQQDRYQEVYGKLVFYEMCGYGAAQIIGGFLAKISFRAPFYATIPCFALALIVALSLREPPRKMLQAKHGYGRELVKILKYAFLEHPRLRSLILFSGVVMGFNSAAVWFYQPYFQLCGLDIAYFGVAFASFQVVSALSAKFAHHTEQRLGSKYSLIALVICSGAGYLLMGYGVFLLGFMFGYFHQFVRGFSRTVLTDYINQLTESDVRATVLSAQSLVMRLCYALLIPICGRIADVTSLEYALKILGAIVLISGGSMLVLLHKECVL